MNIRERFDKIYVLHRADATSRLDSVYDEFGRLGVKPEQINIWWTTKKPVNNIIGDNLVSLHDWYYDNKRQSNPDLYGNVFDVSYNHYSIIAQAYARGFENILICEDDIAFIQNTEYIDKVLDAVPDDADIVKYHHKEFYHQDFDVNVSMFDIESENDITEDIYDPYHPLLWGSCLMYSMNRRGMKGMLDVYDEAVRTCDVVFNHVNSDTAKIRVLRAKICYPKFNSLTENL